MNTINLKMLTDDQLRALESEVFAELQRRLRRFCSEGCGRELWPHEDGWCDVCGGGTPADERPDYKASGTYGAFVLPAGEVTP